MFVRGWTLATSPLYRNAFLIMGSNVASGGLGFFFYLFAANLYTPNDLGYAQSLFNTVSFLATLAVLGLGVGVLRFLPEAQDKRALINTCLTLVGLVALPIAAVFLLGIEVFLPSLDYVVADPIYPVVIVLALLAVAFAPILDQAGYALRRADLMFWRSLSTSALKVPLVVVFALFAVTAGRLGMFLAISLPLGVSVVLEGAVLLPRLLAGYRPRPSLDLREVRPIVRFSLGNYLAATIGAADGLLLLPLIIAVLGNAVGPSQAAYFQIATVVAGLLAIIPSAAFTSFLAEASQRHATPQQRHADERKAILLTLALLLPAIAGAWYFAPLILGLFGGAYRASYVSGSVGALQILIFGSIPAFLGAVLGTRILVRKRTAPLILAAVVSTTVTLGLGYVLLLSDGIVGLAVASVLGTASSLPVLFVAAHRSFRSDPGSPRTPDSTGT